MKVCFTAGGGEQDCSKVCFTAGGNQLCCKGLLYSRWECSTAVKVCFTAGTAVKVCFTAGGMQKRSGGAKGGLEGDHRGTPWRKAAGKWGSELRGQHLELLRARRSEEPPSPPATTPHHRCRGRTRVVTWKRWPSRPSPALPGPKVHWRIGRHQHGEQ